jgi:hypothetical protein
VYSESSESGQLCTPETDPGVEGEFQLVVTCCVFAHMANDWSHVK